MPFKAIYWIREKWNNFSCIWNNAFLINSRCWKTITHSHVRQVTWDVVTIFLHYFCNFCIFSPKFGLVTAYAALRPRNRFCHPHQGLGCTKYCERWRRGIFPSAKVHHRSYNAQSKFGTARRSWTLGSARSTQKYWMLDYRYFANFLRAVIKHCTNFGRAFVSVLRADTELLERFGR